MVLLSPSSSQNVVLIFFLLFTTMLSASSAEMTKSCGYLATEVMTNCGQPELTKPQQCCKVLRAFNNASCWCHPAAFALMSSLTANSFGFIGREEFCKITDLKSPQVGDRNGICQKDTCPKDLNLPSNAKGEFGSDSTQCENPAALRKKREDAISMLESLYLDDTSEKAITDFRNKLQKLFVPDVMFMSIGITADISTKFAIDYLLSRQEKLGSTVPWNSKTQASEMSGIVWNHPAQMSYYSSLKTGSRSMFIGFEACSDKILELVFEEGRSFSTVGTQFYYPDPSEVYGQFNLPAKKICEKINDSCKDLNPFKSTAECESFMKEKKDAKQVFCNNFKNAQLFPFALYGDTIACRYQYALMAAVNPKDYCPSIGKKGMDICSSHLCPKNYYDDIFLNPGPRFLQSSSFTTSEEGCTELWPESDIDFS